MQENKSLKELVESYESTKALKMNASVLKRMREAEASSQHFLQIAQEREAELQRLAEQLKAAQLQIHSVSTAMSWCLYRSYAMALRCKWKLLQLEGSRLQLNQLETSTRPS